MMKNQKLLLSIALLIGTVVTALADPPTAPAGKKWEKIQNMSDEFNGTSLDGSKWAKSDPQWAGRKPGRFEEGAISVSGGNLRVTADKLSNPSNGWTHQGGLVRSIDKNTYGYYETRMKANKTFMSSTFWLFNKRSEGSGCDVRTTELDITETVGWNTGGHNWINNNMRRMNSNTHSRGTTCNSTPTGTQGGKAELGELAYQNYHIYGVWWKSKNELLFYLDNQYKFTITPPADFNLPMYLRMVVETYDWNPPKPGNDGINGSFANRTTYYDWTRSWKLVDDNNPAVQGPFEGTARPIPGTIEAEDYDIGGQGVAYNDADAANNGPDVAREDEGVDLEARDGGINVGWTADGEWLEYTVNATAGTYDMEARIATTTTGKSIVVKLDGATLGTFNLPNTGDWGTFQTVKVENVAVSGGNDKILRIEFVGGGVNLNWVKFTATGGPGGGGDPVTTTLEPVHDAYLQGSARHNNNLVRVESGNRVGYLMYNLSGINGTITAAQLKMTCHSDPGNGNIRIDKGNSNNWTENNLSNSNKPSSSGVLGNLNTAYSTGSTYTWSLTASSLSGGGNLSLIVTHLGGNDVAFASKENSATAPQLVVTYTPSGARIRKDAEQAERVASMIKAYPNPLLKGQDLIIGLYNGVDSEIKIFDAFGRLVYFNEKAQNQLTIPGGTIPGSGIYLIQVKSAKAFDLVKILVE